jgi:hypothetical protein
MRYVYLATEILFDNNTMSISYLVVRIHQYRIVIRGGGRHQGMNN